MNPSRYRSALKQRDKVLSRSSSLKKNRRNKLKRRSSRGMRRRSKSLKLSLRPRKKNRKVKCFLQQRLKQRSRSRRAGSSLHQLLMQSHPPTCLESLRVISQLLGQACSLQLHPRRKKVPTLPQLHNPASPIPQESQLQLAFLLLNRPNRLAVLELLSLGRPSSEEATSSCREEARLNSRHSLSNSNQLNPQVLTPLQSTLAWAEEEETPASSRLLFQVGCRLEVKAPSLVVAMPNLLPPATHLAKFNLSPRVEGLDRALLELAFLQEEQAVGQQAVGVLCLGVATREACLEEHSRAVEACSEGEVSPRTRVVRVSASAA